MRILLEKYRERIEEESKKRDEKLWEAIGTADMVVRELERLRKQFYDTAMEIFDKNIVQNLKIDFIMSESYTIYFKINGITIYRGTKSTGDCEYDSLKKDPWIDNASRAMLYAYVIKNGEDSNGEQPAGWKKKLHTQVNAAVIKEMERTVEVLRSKPVYSLPYDKKVIEQIKAKEYEKVVKELEKKDAKKQLNHDNIKEELVKLCFDTNREPILVELNNLCVSKNGKMFPVSPSKIRPGLYLHEQYMQYVGDEMQSTFRGLSHVEKVYFDNDRLVILTKEYVVSNIDITDEYEQEQRKRRK